MPRNLSRRCWVPNCRNSKSINAINVRLFQFPRNVHRCAQWLSAIGDDKLAQCTWAQLTHSRYVCIEHFLPRYVTPQGRASYSAIPTIGMGELPPLPIEKLAAFIATVPGERSREIRELLAAECGEATVDIQLPNHDKHINQTAVDTNCMIYSTYSLANNQWEDMVAAQMVSTLDNVSPKNSPFDEMEDTEIAEGIKFEDQYADPVTTDHDYICTSQGTYPIQECTEMTEEEPSSQLVLNDLRRELCRLCGRKECHLIPIFEASSSDSSPDMPLNVKIEMYFPFKIRIDDPLPFQVCSNCHDVLNQWHELYVTCVATNAVLWKTLGRESDNSSRNSLDSDISRVQEGSDGEAHESTEGNPLDEGKEYEDLCVECGEQKIEAMREEEMFRKELENCPVTIRSASYKCRYCYEFFKDTLDRRGHLAMCRQLSTICELCGHKVSCRKNLRKHIYLKHTKRIIHCRFPCSMCDRNFQSSVHLNYHVKTVHENDRTPKYHCEPCCLTFVGEHLYRAHLRKHEKGQLKAMFQFETLTGDENPEAPAEYPCPVCKETFNDKFSLVVHLNTKKKVVCPVCQKVSASEKWSLLHKCGQWTCEYCFKTFEKKVKWIVHERIHTGEKPIKCRFCDRTFRSWHARRAHESTHEPLLQCSYCGKCFKSRYVFKDHVQCHEGKIFPCQICNKNFTGRKGLLKHTKIVHKVHKISQENHENNVS